MFVGGRLRVIGGCGKYYFWLVVRDSRGGNGIWKEGGIC